MAAYKDLVGQKITKVTSNPGEPKTGQMWYNSTDGKLRGLGIVEATSSQAPLATARGHGSAAGTTTAAIVAFGDTNPVPGSNISPTETWNGSGFSSSPNVGTARKHTTGFGTATSALFAGGPGGAANVETTDDSGYDVRSGVPSWDDMNVVSPGLSKILEKHNITNPQDIKRIQDLQAKQAVADQGVVDADQHYRQIAPSFISGELERRRIEDADSAIAAAKNALGSDDPAIMQQGGPLLQAGINQAVNNERTMTMRKFVADINQQSPMFLDTILSRK